VLHLHLLVAHPTLLLAVHQGVDGCRRGAIALEHPVEVVGVVHGSEPAELHRDVARVEQLLHVSLQLEEEAELVVELEVILDFQETQGDVQLAQLGFELGAHHSPVQIVAIEFLCQDLPQLGHCSQRFNVRVEWQTEEVCKTFFLLGSPLVSLLFLVHLVLDVFNLV